MKRSACGNSMPAVPKTGTLDIQHYRTYLLRIRSGLRYEEVEAAADDSQPRHVMCVDCFRTFSTSRVDERKLVRMKDRDGYTVGCPMGCADSFIDPACFTVSWPLAWASGPIVLHQDLPLCSRTTRLTILLTSLLIAG